MVVLSLVDTRRGVFYVKEVSNSRAGIGRALFVLSLYDKNAALMRCLATRILQLAWLLLHTRGYFISPSCYSYRPHVGPEVQEEKQDLSNLVKAAMAEAKVLAELGEKNIMLPLEDGNNSKSLLFPGANDVHLQKARGKRQGPSWMAQ
jgi:hypothetical protein